MPDTSSGKLTATDVAVMQLSISRRLAMVLLGYIPLLHVGGAVALIVLPLLGRFPLWAIWLAPALLYLLPPVVVRAMLLLRPLHDGQYRLDSREFLWWWFSAQWQIVFNRLPFLEEILRLVPGLYSLWLRLWGARVGSLVYWSPGCAILDRPFLHVGKQTVFGAAARVHPHLILRKPNGQAELVLARIVIGDEALIGGLALLLPGVKVHDRQQVRGARPAAPYSEFRDGRCIRHKHWLEEESNKNETDLRG